MTEEEKSIELFDNKNNCAQSTYLACRDKSFLDEKTAAYISGIFGGGVSLGQTCGALCGAIMALSERFTPMELEDREQRSRAYIMKRTFGKWFEDEYGSCMCNVLRSVVPMGESSHPLCTNFVAGCARKINEITALCECRRIEPGSPDFENVLPLRQDALILPSTLQQDQVDISGGKDTVHLGLFSLGYLLGTVYLTPLDDENIQISPLFLDKDYHKTGTDRLLIAFAEKTAGDLGFKTIHASAGTCKYTQPLYEELGYSEAAEGDADFGLSPKHMKKALDA